MATEGAAGMVPFYDAKLERVVKIPISELARGAVWAQDSETGEEFWVMAESLETNNKPIHPPLNEDLCKKIIWIQKVFKEPRGLSFKEWEDGFRCDQYPEREIALWVNAANIYERFAGKETKPSRRREIYDVVITYLISSGAGIQYILNKYKTLSQEEVAAIIKDYVKGYSDLSNLDKQG
jgi:hypothetical protein